MSDFTSGFWPWFIFIPTALGLIGLVWLIHWMSKSDESDKKETTGHEWDGLQELNNPLPRWWLNLFYITIVFGVVYLILYPGSGIYKGYLEWTSVKRYNAEMKEVNARLKPMYDGFLKQPIEKLAQDKRAMQTGIRIFQNNCSTCHGSDGGGARGFPSLKDNDWLWGGSAKAIQHSIAKGRTGVMPAWGGALPGDKLTNMVDYVLSLSGRQHDAASAAKAKVTFGQMCAGCHGADGRGKQAQGAPNLTDKVWLHGATRKQIQDVIAKGRQGQMPAHDSLLSPAKIHLLAAYVYSLSNSEETKEDKKKTGK